MLYRTAYLVLRPIVKLLFRPVVEGVRNIPASGPVILASNHLSFADSIFIPLMAPRRVVFLAKSEYFTGRGVRGLLSRWWFTTLGTVPVERGTHRAAQASLDTAVGVLRAGDAFGIYPEGTRSRDGRLYRGRTGIAWLALETGAPVVPVGVTGTGDVQPAGARVPRIRPFAVRFGEPLDFTGRFGGVPPGKARRAITDEVMAAIHALSGQELAGTYNEAPPDAE
jgi:1-acyl-sn-glycerol-3-phosphate acyltransferase